MCLSGTVKLCDFGSSKKFNDIYTNKRVSVTFKYTPLWTAPEVLAGESEYNGTIDIWSLGCVIIEMATGKPPWSNIKFESPMVAVFKIGNENITPGIPKNLSPDGTKFVSRCLHRDPARRETADQLRQRTWEI